MTDVNSGSLAHPPNPYKIHNLGEILFHGRAGTEGARGIGRHTISGGTRHHTKNAVCIQMKSIIAQLILNMEDYEQTAGHTNGQTGYVDERIGLVFLDVAKGDF